MQRKLYGFLNHASPVILRPMRASVKPAIALMAMVFGQQLGARAADPFDALAAQDRRLAMVAERLMEANDALCTQHMPALGLVIESRDQYPANPGDKFANGPVAVAQVLPGSPAAGIVEPGDSLVAIGAVPTASLRAQGKSPQRDAVFAALADSPPSAPLSLTLARGGSERTVTLHPIPACRALVEVRSSNGDNARSDGKVIQVDYGLAAETTDDQLAVIFAHELGHLVLEHRRRLSQAGVSKGFFGELGRNGRLNRQVEDEADLISVHLLANAGYDPAIAPAFWRSALGRRLSGLSLVYHTSSGRAERLEREIAEHLPGGAHPGSADYLLARRTVPFS